MARDRNTFQKQQRENQKRRKAEDKRVRRQKRKQDGVLTVDRPAEEGSDVAVTP